ncbi:MAG: VOC family protein [bacterium]
MITGIGHAAFRVRDLEKSLSFYTKVMGFPEAFRLNDDAGNLILVYLKVGEGGFIELFPGGKTSVELPRDHIGYCHLCLTVDDIRKTLKELKSRGLPIEGEAKRGKDGNYQYWVEDPDGNPIELMQIMADSLQAQSRRG